MPIDNKLELFYHVDNKDKVLGSVTRGKAHQGNSIKHRSVFILVFNKGQLLFQKRSLSKDKYGGFWTASASGHVTFGETYIQAAKKELKEELGLILKLKRLKKIYIPAEREFAVIFQGKFDNTSINFDKTEITQTKWIKVNLLKKFIQKNKVTPGCKDVLKSTGYID